MELVGTFAEDSAVQDAARMAKIFHWSPIEILKAPTHEVLMWAAAMRVVSEDSKKEAAEMKAKSRKR